jgi:hypothetical protein
MVNIVIMIMEMILMLMMMLMTVIITNLDKNNKIEVVYAIIWYNN